MQQMYVIGEDALSCALGEVLVKQVTGWKLAVPPVNTNGVTKLEKNLPRYTTLAAVHPVLCIADVDRGCAIQLCSQWLPRGAPTHFLLRLAVTECESWLMADREALANFFGVALATVSMEPDALPDAKLALLQLARRSRQREIRQEVVATFDNNKQGNGYNLHLCRFVKEHWRSQQAKVWSPSLARAVTRLQELKKSFL